jgi:ABC-type branched-subunit amino acid transport system substrate-binding protein
MHRNMARLAGGTTMDPAPDRLDRPCGRRRSPGRRGILVVVCALAVLLAACSSTQASTTPTTSASGHEPPIPSAAFSDRTGLTATTVRIGNVSTLLGGLFKGALVGTQAYAAYVNAQGGVAGRKIVVDSGNDNYAGAPNRQLTQQDILTDFAMVGSFSLQDNFGGAILAKNPQVPNVAVNLDETTAELPNSFSPAPTPSGWQLGPVTYYQKKFPSLVHDTGALIADQPSAETKWASEKAAMTHIGYRVVYDPTFDITTSNFDQYVVDMRDAGVKILFLEQMPFNYAGAVFKALDLEDFHPVIVLGGSTYSSQLVSSAGGPSAIDGSYFEQPTALYLGSDAAYLPAVRTFQTWVQRVSPGFSPDLYTLYGWVSTQLFVQALRSAGPDPSRGSVLQALRGITSFSGGDIVGPADPAKKIPTNCYIIGRVEGGQIQRLDDPPINGPTHGFRCDQPFFYTNPS